MITVNEYLKSQFGEKVYKIALNAGLTCPNRDGTLGDRGCIFCSGSGSGDFAPTSNMSIKEQIEDAKKRVKDKGASKYIAYFQAFTNTYAPVDTLRVLYEDALSKDDIVGLSIATRPDCLGDDVLDLLSEINKKTMLWVELGLQTIHQKSAEYIRRGYELTVYDKAVRDLNAIGIPQIITHVILGLPGESREDMLSTVRYVANPPKAGGHTSQYGIKLQLLHIIKGTDLADEYAKGLVPVMSMDEYVSLIDDCLKLLPDDMVVHRMTGDGDKRTLIAPLWSADKKRVMNAIRSICHPYEQ